MSKRFDLLLRIFLVCSILLGGLAIVRLFSWASLLSIDKFFYVFAVVLLLFAFVLVLLLRVPEPVIVDSPLIDAELESLREEAKKIVIPEPKVEREREFHRLETDTSMYDEPIVNRNIIKDVKQSEDIIIENDNGNDYRGVF